MKFVTLYIFSSIHIGRGWYFVDSVQCSAPKLSEWFIAFRVNIELLLNKQINYYICYTIPTAPFDNIFSNLVGMQNNKTTKVLGEQVQTDKSILTTVIFQHMNYIYRDIKSASENWEHTQSNISYVIKLWNTAGLVAANRQIWHRIYTISVSIYNLGVDLYNWRIPHEGLA